MRKKITLILVLLIVVSLAGSGTYLYAQSRNARSGSSGQDVNYHKPNPTEKRAAEPNKGKTPDTRSTSTNKTPSSTTSKIKVSVVITTYNDHDNGNLTVNGYVDGIVESGGTCTLTLKDSTGKTISSSRPAQPDATTTTCGQSVIPLSKLHAGTWQATLSYSSATSAGTTDPNDPRNQIEID